MVFVVFYQAETRIDYKISGAAATKMRRPKKPKRKLEPETGLL